MSRICRAVIPPGLSQSSGDLACLGSGQRAWGAGARAARGQPDSSVPCRQSLSSLSGPLQVVPDIDDQMSNADSSQEVSREGQMGHYPVPRDQRPGRTGMARAEMAAPGRPQGRRGLSLIL